MMRKAVLLLIPLLGQCARGPVEVADKGIDRVPFHQAKTGSSLAGAAVPVLHSPTLEKRWRKPEITVLPDGSYHLYYSKPGDSFESLAIYAVPGVVDSDSPVPPTYNDIGYDEKRKQPKIVTYPQKWQSVNILSRPIHVFIDSPGGGADPLQHSTVTFSHQLPGKPIGSYRITATSNQEDAERWIHSYMKTVSF